ncbi:MAG: protoheme farnesyltransferase, partial [Devosia sp.]|nr:protoheme farnesyltransferase [Devosia sp.]
TGSVSIESVVLFLIIFLWTPPHFWALALYKQSDYGAAGVPMMPNVVGNDSTKLQIFVYTLVLAASAMLPVVLGFSGMVYSAVAVVTGLSFILLAWRLLRTGEEVAMRKSARILFNYSLSYLFVVFFAYLADNLLARFGGFV